MLTPKDVDAICAAESNVVCWIARAIFPGWYALGLFLIAVLSFGLPLTWFAAAAACWALAHIAFRPSKAGAAIGEWIGDAAHAIGTRIPRPTPKSAPAAAPANVVSIADPINQAPPPRVEASPPPLRFDWSRSMRDFLPLLVIAAALLVWVVVGGGLHLWGKSGREVAADARTGIAQAENTTSQAETRQAQQTVVRVEAHTAELNRLRQEVAHAREEIQDAPDLETRVAAAAAFAERMRLDAEAARAAALQDYDSSLVS